MVTSCLMPWCKLEYSSKCNSTSPLDTLASKYRKASLHKIKSSHESPPPKLLVGIPTTLFYLQPTAMLCIKIQPNSHNVRGRPLHRKSHRLPSSTMPSLSPTLMIKPTI